MIPFPSEVGAEEIVGNAGLKLAGPGWVPVLLTNPQRAFTTRARHANRSAPVCVNVTNVPLSCSTSQPLAVARSTLIKKKRAGTEIKYPEAVPELKGLYSPLPARRARSFPTQSFERASRRLSREAQLERNTSPSCDDRH